MSVRNSISNNGLPSPSSILKNETVPRSVDDDFRVFSWTRQLNQSILVTGFYVLAALSSIIVLYFVFRALRLRRRNYKVRRYGVIASREDVEMTPLENEDDDEDSTVFDISMKNNIRS